MKKIAIFGTLFLLFVAVFSSCNRDEHSMLGELRGIVSDFETGELLDGVTVTLSPGGRNQVTGNNGIFHFTDVDPQQYTITAQRSGFQTNRRTINAIANETIEVNITLTRNP